jgi:hypothetical protein
MFVLVLPRPRRTPNWLRSLYQCLACWGRGARIAGSMPSGRRGRRWPAATPSPCTARPRPSGPMGSRTRGARWPSLTSVRCRTDERWLATPCSACAVDAQSARPEGLGDRPGHPVARDRLAARPRRRQERGASGHRGRMKCQGSRPPLANSGAHHGDVTRAGSWVLWASGTHHPPPAF